MINRKYFVVIHTTTKIEILYTVSPMSDTDPGVLANNTVVSSVLGLQPWPRDHLHWLRFSFTYNCYYLLYMSARFRVCPCISPQEPRNIFLEISCCRTLL